MEAWQGLRPEPPVVRRPLALELHATNMHAQPFVQGAEQLPATGERGGEVGRRAAHHRVDLRNDPRIQVVAPTRHVSNLGLELLHGLLTRRDVEAQEGKAFAETSSP
jgi:hypothetical protein